MDLMVIGEVVGIATGSGGAAWGVWRYAVRPYIWVPTTTMIRNVRAIPTMQLQHEAFVQQQKEIYDRLGCIVKELQPNGGSSLRDCIDQVRDQVNRNWRMSRAMLSTATDGYVEFSAEGELVEVSRGILRRLGRSERELLGSNWIACLNVHDRRKATTEIEHALRDQRDIELTLDFQKPGSTRPSEGITVQLSLQAIGPVDKPDGWVGTLRFP